MFECWNFILEWSRSSFLILLSHAENVSSEFNTAWRVLFVFRTCQSLKIRRIYEVLEKRKPTISGEVVMRSSTSIKLHAVRSQRDTILQTQSIFTNHHSPRNWQSCRWGSFVIWVITLHWCIIQKGNKRINRWITNFLDRIMLATRDTTFDKPRR